MGVSGGISGGLDGPKHEQKPPITCLLPIVFRGNCLLYSNTFPFSVLGWGLSLEFIPTPLVRHGPSTCHLLLPLGHKKGDKTWIWHPWIYHIEIQSHREMSGRGYQFLVRFQASSHICRDNGGESVLKDAFRTELLFSESQQETAEMNTEMARLPTLLSTVHFLCRTCTTQKTSE